MKERSYLISVGIVIYIVMSAVDRFIYHIPNSFSLIIHQKSRHIIGDSVIIFTFTFLENDYFNNSIISSSLFDNDLEISSKLIPCASIALIPSFIT